MAFRSVEMIISLSLRDIPEMDVAYKFYQKYVEMLNRFAALADELAMSEFNIDCKNSDQDEDAADYVHYIPAQEGFPHSIHISSQQLQFEENRQYLIDYVARELQDVRKALHLPTVLQFFVEGTYITEGK